MTGPTVSRGQQLLAAHVKKQGDLRALSKRIGLDERVLGNYLRGVRKPVTSTRFTLYKTLNIPVLSWDALASSGIEDRGGA